MKRLRIALIWLAATAALPAAGQTYTDWWWNPDQSGQGINVGQEGNVAFMAWFTYDESGDGMWLVMGGPLAGSTLDQDLYRTSGPKLGTPFNPADVVAAKVGHGTLAFSDLFNATFTWSVDGKSGSLALVRETFGAPALVGRYVASMFGTATAQCNVDNGVFHYDHTFTVSDAAFTDAQINDAGNSLNFAGTPTREGRWITVAGEYTGASAGQLKGGPFTQAILPMDDVVFLDESQGSRTAGCVGTLQAVGLQ